jgi:putative tryptophan/tyrosine transport system substrate-binding protein
VKRREFIPLLGGAAAASWSLAAHAQQTERMRRIGMLSTQAEADPEIQARLDGFRHGLQALGWVEGRNLHIDYRFADGRADRVQPLAKELIVLKPELIFAQGTPAVAVLQRESRTLPVVFVHVSDPIGSGFVASLARPGGNLTGVLQYEASITGKWLAMLKEISPTLVRAALVANPKTTPFPYFQRAALALAPSLAIEVVASPVQDASDIERVIESFARVPNGGLVLPPDGTTGAHRDLIVGLAARHRLPAVYSLRTFVEDGGLMSYGADQADMFRQAAGYVDRILRGADPADLPVRVPVKYETILNLKTAKALDLAVPPGLLVAADKVIE